MSNVLIECIGLSLHDTNDGLDLIQKKISYILVFLLKNVGEEIVEPDDGVKRGSSLESLHSHKWAKSNPP